MKTLRIFILITVLLISTTSFNVKAADINKNGSGGNITNNTSTKDDYGKLPQKYNSQELGYTTRVKNQCNSTLCWAYASNSSFESLLLKNNIFVADLSVEHMDKWATPSNDGCGWQREENEVGYTYIPCGYYTSWSGPTTATEDEVPSTQGVTSIVYLGKNDTELIKKTIMKSGAVTANLIINNKAYSLDNNSYCLNKTTKNLSGHTMSVVGWDDNYSKNFFDGYYRPEKNGAWLCKNSWGDNINSIGGYLWVSYEDKYIFDNELFAPSYGINKYININNETHLYQNEVYGATYEFEYLSEEDNDITYMNVFDFSENGNVLNKVIFESTALGAEYKTFFVPLKDEKPIEDKEHWKELSHGTIEFEGYICDDIKTVIPKAKGAIAVEIITKSEKEKNSIGIDEWLTEDDVFVFKDICEKGKGFIRYNDKIEDVKDIYKERMEDDIGGNLVIKAVVDESYDINYGDVNQDKAVNIKDCTEIQKYIAKIKSLDIYKQANADFNKDNVLNIMDVTSIQKKIAKIC